MRAQQQYKPSMLDGGASHLGTSHFTSLVWVATLKGNALPATLKGNALQS